MKKQFSHDQALLDVTSWVFEGDESANSARGIKANADTILDSDRIYH